MSRNPWAGTGDLEDGPTGLDLVTEPVRPRPRTEPCERCGAEPNDIHATGCGDPWFEAMTRGQNR
jgi:hypothetical protein